MASSYDDDWRESVKMRFCIYCRAEIGMTDRVIYACKKCESKLPKKKAAKEAPLITKNVPTVSEIANLAAAAGMSYGQYVSKYGV